MPKIYLCPSPYEQNYYADGGNEQYYTNLIADEIETHLKESGFDVIRSRAGMSLLQATDESNDKNCDVYVAIRSITSPKSKSGKCNGEVINYYPYSKKGKVLAKKVQDNLCKIYREPHNVEIITTDTPAELHITRAVAIIIKAGFHDNPKDAKFIRENTESIGKSIAKAVADYLKSDFANA